MESPPRDYDYDDDDELSVYLPNQRPNTAAPQTIGILNIIFGFSLLLCGICCSFVQSGMAGMQQQQFQQQFQQGMEDVRQQQVLKLQLAEKAAKNDKEKADLIAQQNLILAQPMKMPDIDKFMDETNILGFMIVEIGSGFFLNVLLIVSGIGLLGYREWARTMAIWTAVLKILRLVALYAYWILAIVPAMVKEVTDIFQEMFDNMAKAMPPGQDMPGPGDIEKVGSAVGAMATTYAVAMIVLGVIYPLVVVIALGRPRVKAACAARPPQSD